MTKPVQKARKRRIKARAGVRAARPGPRGDKLEAAYREALEHQKASAETLRVISSARGDIQPVLRAVAESAAHLCNASNVHIRLVQGELMPVVAHVGPISLPSAALAQRISPGTVAGRAILERRTIHIHDMTTADVRSEYPEASAFVSQASPFKTLLVVPLLRDEAAIGT